MATFTENIRIVLKGAGKAGKDAQKVSTAMKGLATSALAAGAAYFGTRGIINGLSASIDLFKKQEMAEKKLEAALGKTSIELLNYAKSLQQVTTFGDEAILEAQALIGAFVKDEEAIKAATKATLDLAAAKGFDLVASADLVSKTLGSSTNALSRYGIQVEGAVGSTERLESLTGNLAAVFGGQATAQAQTYTGRIEQAKNELGDMGEEIGQKLIPHMANLMSSLSGVTRGFMDFFGLSLDVNDAINQNTNSIMLEQQQLDSLFRRTTEENTTKEEKAKLIDELNMHYGKYTTFLLDEESSLEKISKFYEQTNEIFQKNITLKTLQAKASFFQTQADEESANIGERRIKLESDILEILNNKSRFVASHGKLLENLNKIEKDYIDTETGLVNISTISNDKLIELGETIGKNLAPTVSTMESSVAHSTRAFENSNIEVQKNIDLATENTTLANNYTETLLGQGLVLDEYGQVVEIVSQKLNIMNQEMTKSNDLGLKRKKITEPEVEYLTHLYINTQKVSDAVGELTLAQVNGAMAVGAAYKNAGEAAKQAAAAYIIAAAQEAVASFIKDSFAKFGIFGGIAGAAASGIVGSLISGAVGQMKTVAAAEGMDKVITEPTLILAGEEGPEYVNIEPTMNEGVGMGGANITFTGNVLSRDFIEDEAVPMIREALRKGGDLGIS